MTLLEEEPGSKVICDTIGGRAWGQRSYIELLGRALGSKIICCIIARKEE